ncbi:uncharacterized protein V6R79_002916 [Siganus canaliculatus]
MLEEGDWVWVDSDIGVPIGARIQVTPSGRRLLVTDDGKEEKLSQKKEASLRRMHPTSVEGVDDMIQLGDMTEAGLLRNLVLRHKRGIIYTYVGSVLVAVNPYQDFPIYTDEQVKLYRDRKLGELPPHIFALAEACYSNMKRHQKSQCCIISGESGAGKTESSKLILKYLAAVSGEVSEQQIEQQILESNPILEAFGNAKTIRNDNSSRFGKYLEIFYSKNGAIQGARMEQYLLEKSRVCHQALDERNYHIFYCMLAGIRAEDKKALSLGEVEDYTFLTKGDCIECEGRNDAKDYRRILSAMKILTFSDVECWEISKLLAAILHLGNISFEANTLNNLETSDVSKSRHFTVASSLLEVDKSLLATSLTHRSFATKNESVTKPLSSEQASDCRDALAKAIYNKLFVWIGNKINNVIHKNVTKNPKSSFLSIGLLDIFGFENFVTNSFEQLCINFANEKLQQFFVGHVFKLEQKEYKKEDVVWKNIRYEDNQEVLDLLAVKPCNLLALIDEESHFPKGSDLTMLNKMNQQHSENQKYITSGREYDTEFGIHHFAGVVYYDSTGFLEKNRDAISSDIIKMVDLSSSDLLRRIFENELSVSTVKMGNRKVIMTPRNSLRAQADNFKHVPTLSGQFRQSLDSLMKALSVCQPFFIRCFKPNNDKKSAVFDRELCVRQLRYSGMMDTIHIRKLGYPIRHTFENFLNRYRVLLETTVCNPKTNTAAACCEAICKSVLRDKDVWRIGKTKVFLKDAHDATLERLREQELKKAAMLIRGVLIGNQERKSFLEKRRAAVVLQRQWRAYMERRVKTAIHHNWERLVAKIRGRKLQRQFQREHSAAVIIQSQLRGYWVRRTWKQKRQAAIVLQAYTRGMLARKIARNIRDNPSLLPRHDSYDVHLNPLVDVVERESSESELEESETDSRSQTPEPVRELATLISSSLTPSPSLEEEDDEFDEGSDEFSLFKFSLLHFQDASHSHITQRLKQPLLPHDDEGDALACLTVWWIILRYMEDLPEPRSLDTVSQPPSPVQRHPIFRQGRRLSHLVGLDQKILRKDKKKFGSANRRASTIPEEPEDMAEDENILIGEGPTLDRPLTSQEKLHIIIGYALSRPGIRDEIYCQICKQLSNNRSGKSRMQGWTLLSICLGIFPPTDFFMKYLESFVRKAPIGHRAYCTERLRRIVANGERMELPCSIELQAAKTKKPIDVSVALMDDRAVSLQLDSSSTSAEVCQALAHKIDLQDMYGFSLYISMFDKMWSLGSCGKHVFDAVSQCEQEMRRQGMKEKDAPWRLSFRKELFTPWHDCSADPISTDLIYQQVIKGVKAGEYTCDKEDEYVLLAVQHYYIQFGSAYSRENVKKVVEECITTRLIESKSMTKWIDLITTVLMQVPFVSGVLKTENVKKELVDGAREKWPLYFSKFYEVIMMSGPALPVSRFVVAVNWSGVLFMDGRDKKLLELLFLEIKDVHLTNQSHLSAATVNLTTIRGEFVLKAEEAADMAALIDSYLEGLKQRSVYALAQQDASKPDDPTFLVCKRGDLLLIDNKDASRDQNWMRATNERTSNNGTVYKDTVQFLPTLSKPPEDILNLLTAGQKKIAATLTTSPRDETVAPVSIKEFALEYFRPKTSKEAGKKGASRGVSKERLWAFSREPLRQPLLKSLTRSSELSSLACNAFTDIPETKYTGDYPIKHTRSPVELTDQIFGPATQLEALQDEIYCQIMRQMTNNNNRLSVERGWQLMWLCSGLFPPSHNLFKYTQRFLESRPRDLLSADCLQRLQGMRSKDPRKFPPHPVEVDAIQQNSAQIFHKIHFPNETDDIFEVSSTTTIKELCQSIATELTLSSAEGYGLYLKIPKNMISLDEEQYFFDSLRQASDIPKKGRRGKEGKTSCCRLSFLHFNAASDLQFEPCFPGNTATMLYLVMFKRKLWFNVTPGKDLVADLTFHFPQELPKYLRGYHTCSRDDMINLGGLLFRVLVDSDRSQFVMIPKMLKGLVPADHIKSMSSDEWKKHIISSYNKQSGMTVQEAKIAFLQAISSWPNFGCAFFEAKQTRESSYPSTVLIVISKQDVGILDPKTKEMLIMHPFSRISDYHSKGDQFQMTVGTLVKGNNFVCFTPKVTD